MRLCAAIEGTAMQTLKEGNSLHYGFCYKSGILEIVDIMANRSKRWSGKAAKDICRDGWIAVYGANIAWGMRGFAFDEFCRKIFNDPMIPVDIPG
jgi:hypothetical protein